jgi:hypothetical protein
MMAVLFTIIAVLELVVTYLEEVGKVERVREDGEGWRVHCKDFSVEDKSERSSAREVSNFEINESVWMDGMVMLAIGERRHYL